MIIRDIANSDLDQIVRVHRQAFNGFFMTLLGPKFLKEYYSVCINYQDNISLLYESESKEIIGFAVGFLNPKKFYSELSKRKIDLLISAFAHLIQKPGLWKRMLESYLFAKTKTSERDSSEFDVELASIAVDPEYKGKEAGKKLLDNFIDRAKNKGAKKIALTTDTENNEDVNIFYQKAGFKKIRTFEKSNGRLVNEYIYFIYEI